MKTSQIYLFRPRKKDVFFSERKSMCLFDRSVWETAIGMLEMVEGDSLLAANIAHQPVVAGGKLLVFASLLTEPSSNVTGWNYFKEEAFGSKTSNS